MLIGAGKCQVSSVLAFMCRIINSVIPPTTNLNILRLQQNSTERAGGDQSVYRFDLPSSGKAESQ